MKELHQITFKDLCFAVEVESGLVTFTAPAAKWMVNKKWIEMKSYWSNRGAKIIKCKLGK